VYLVVLVAGKEPEERPGHLAATVAESSLRERGRPSRRAAATVDQSSQRERGVAGVNRDVAAAAEGLWAAQWEATEGASGGGAGFAGVERKKRW
jgi:hypothetical protein